jgi:hypothetical protein
VTEPVRKVRASAKQAGNRGLGRKKGVPNKVTGALKEMILQALDESGGVDYLKRQASKNPAAFLTLVGKLVPAEINAKVEAEVGPELAAWLDKRS